VYGDVALLIIEDLVVPHLPIFSARKVLGEALPVGLDGSQAGHPELLGTPKGH